MITNRSFYKKGKLQPKQPGNLDKFAEKGLISLEDNNGKAGLLYIPNDYQPSEPSPFALMLHGAGGRAEHGLSYLKNYAEKEKVIVAALSSRDYSWDIIASGSFDADVIYIDSMLDYIFSNYSINRQKLAIGGFSDGASYALSLGLSNGHLFSHIIAFSPRFIHTREPEGTPKIFMSHGERDDVLPINPCSRRIYRQLENRYPIYYVEFDGKHEIPDGVSGKAIEWFIKEPEKQ